MDTAVDVTENYHGGNLNSVEAHESVKSVKRKLRALVIGYVKMQGLRGATSDEVEVALGMTHQSISARMTEAKADGQIVGNGLRRPTRSGRNAAVYIAV